MAQYVHLAAIVGLARVEPGILDDPLGLYGGGFGFVLIGLMAATSNDAALKRLGGRNWTRLHRFGQLTLAIVYLATYGPHFAEDVSSFVKIFEERNNFRFVGANEWVRRFSDASDIPDDHGEEM